MKPVGVIILNWNGQRLLNEFLPSIIRHNPDGIADVIVADNGSSDGSLQLLARKFPSVKVMPFERNLGFAAGYNRAIREAGYEFSVLLNSDVAAKGDWLTPLYDFMVAHPDVGACQPKIRSYRHPDMFEYAGAAGGFLDKHGFPYCRGRIFDAVEPDNGQYDIPMEVDWASGAALMVRSAAYESVGGLDDAFFAHMEEIDLCWRLRAGGWKVAAVSDAEPVYHLGGGSLPVGNPRKVYLNFRNNLLMLRKNLPRRRRTARLVWRRLIDTLALANYLLHGHFSSAWAVVRAHLDYARMAAKYPRELPGAIDLLKDKPDVVMVCYLRRRRKFADL